MADTNSDMLQDILARVKAMQGNGGNEKPSPIPLIDPTANVKELVLAEAKRQDELREAERRHNAEIRRLQESCAIEVGTLKDRLADADSRRIDALALADSRRIDANRAADAAALALATARAELTASALAERVDTSAKTLAAGQAAAVSAADTRFTRLEQAQYQQGGANVQRLDARAASSSLLPWLVAAGAVIAFLASHYKP